MSEIPVQPRDLHLADKLPQHLKAKVVRLPLEIYNQILGVRSQDNPGQGESTSGHIRHSPNTNPRPVEKV